MLLEKLGKSWHWYIEGIVAIVLLDAGEFRLASDTSRVLKLVKLRLGFSVGSVDERTKCLRLGIVEESALLEEERGVDFAGDIFAHDLADFWDTCVQDGNNLDKLGFLDRLGLARSERSLQVDAPMGAKPNERLGGDDGTAPDESPFLRPNMLLVQIVIEVVSGEYGPDDGEWPDIQMPECWHSVQELRALDLVVFYQGHDE